MPLSTGVPSRRWAAAISASPEVQTAIAAYARAKSRVSPEPIIRPLTPKCAPLDTVLFVPVRGPRSDRGAMRSVPSPMPTALAAIALPNPSPNVMGSQPNTITENARLPPKNTASMLSGRESRSDSGMYSTPIVSTCPKRSSGGEGASSSRGVVGSRFVDTADLTFRGGGDCHHVLLGTEDIPN